MTREEFSKFLAEVEMAADTIRQRCTDRIEGGYAVDYPAQSDIARVASLLAAFAAALQKTEVK